MRAEEQEAHLNLSWKFILAESIHPDSKQPAENTDRRSRIAPLVTPQEHQMDFNMSTFHSGPLLNT